jgi:hypothetical protein
MNRRFVVSPIAVLLTWLCAAAGAQESASPSLTWNGYLLTDDRGRVGSTPYVFSWQEYRLDLKGEFKTDKAHFLGDMWVRSIGFPDIRNSASLQSAGLVSPVDLRLKEAYVDLYGVPFDNLDIRIGRQRIAWGTADKINPTDNLDADDLEDVWDFGRHVGSDGIKLSYYLGDFTMTGAYIPLFTPAVLPAGDFMAALEPTMELPADLQSVFALRSTNDHIDMPARTPKESSSGGLKIGGKIFDYDFSISYVYSHDHFPLIYKQQTTVDFTNGATMPIPLDVDVSLTYPRVHVAGADFAGAIGKVGVRAEAGVFFPEKVAMTQTTVVRGQIPLSVLMSLPPAAATALMSPTSQTAQEDKPYVKWVAGFDYTFPADICVNLQYVHGITYERGNSLEDYLLGNLDWTLLNGKVKLTPIGVGLEIKDYAHLRDNWALVGEPQVTWCPVDNSELLLGAHLIWGTPSTHFGTIKGTGDVYLRTRISF